ncbi:MAG: PAS domain-containing protein, partial [Methanomicrobiales archaeon]|nr:PAS domain-containing protein [Methanomicrobiales archaeon]
MSTELPLDVLHGKDAVEVKDKSISSMYFRCNADAALYLITVDKGATEVAGYLPEELLATGMMTLMDLVAPESRDELRYNIQQGIGEGRSFA